MKSKSTKFLRDKKPTGNIYLTPTAKKDLAASSLAAERESFAVKFKLFTGKACVNATTTLNKLYKLYSRAGESRGVWSKRVLRLNDWLTDDLLQKGLRNVKMTKDKSLHLKKAANQHSVSDPESIVSVVYNKNKQTYEVIFRDVDTALELNEAQT